VPNIVCTTFVAHAFLDLYDATNHAPYRELAESAGRFVTDELAANLPDDAFCIRYQMLENGSVHNASLLGAALLARIHGYWQEARLEDYIRKAAQFTLERQRPDGSWPYGEERTQAWVDSFHTGYNLLALKQIGRQLEVPGLAVAVRRGYEYYRHHFFRADGAVRYFHNQAYPVDAHAVGHALVTLAEFSVEDPTALGQAGRCFDWAAANLRSPQGFFYYQHRGWFTNRISYIRWSQAWMLMGLVSLLRRMESGPGAVASALA
jgi:rhamnogalacturonyl hydrolase YesR